MSLSRSERLFLSSGAPIPPFLIPALRQRGSTFAASIPAVTLHSITQTTATTSNGIRSESKGLRGSNSSSSGSGGRGTRRYTCQSTTSQQQQSSLPSRASLPRTHPFQYQSPSSPPPPRRPTTFLPNPSSAPPRDSKILRTLLRQTSHQRHFHISPTQRKEHYFDTLKFTQRLQDQGFTEEQSAALMKVLSDVIEESVQSLTTTLVARPLQESTSYTQKVDFSQLRSDLISSHNAEYQRTLSEYERLLSEISKLNSRLREETTRTQNSVKLDLNLEKGRIREEASVHELKIKETDTRIESEVGSMRAMLEQVKFSTLQWLIGVCTGTAALILGVWRLLT